LELLAERGMAEIGIGWRSHFGARRLEAVAATPQPRRSWPEASKDTFTAS